MTEENYWKEIECNTDYWDDEGNMKQIWDSELNECYLFSDEEKACYMQLGYWWGAIVEGANPTCNQYELDNEIQVDNELPVEEWWVADFCYLVPEDPECIATKEKLDALWEGINVIKADNW